MLRKQRRFDRKNVIARDVPGRVNAFENDMQREESSSETFAIPNRRLNFVLRPT
jgi:hypothetical protein